VKQNDKIDYNKIAREQGVEESRRIWRLNNADRIQNRKEWIGDTLICPCCEKYYFKIQDNDEICKVCEWQDDSIQRREPERTGGANKLSLMEYKKQWTENQALKEVANLIDLVEKRIPADTILTEAGPSIDIIKSLLAQRGLRELTN
jgi:hypothetical protein